MVNRNSSVVNELLHYIDILVDGDYQKDKYDLSLKFRGSSNQRILDLKPSLQTHKFIEYKL